MARPRRATRSTPESPAAARQPDEVPEPPVHYRRFGVNLALLLLLSIEAGFIWLARPVLVTRLIAIATFFGTVWGVAAVFVLGRVAALFGSEIKKLEKKQRALLQSPRLTFWLTGAALLFFVPGTLAAPWVLDPPPLLWVLPRGVYNDVTAAPDVKDSGFRYVLKIEQGGRSLSEGEVTGKGNIHVGKDPVRQSTWVGKTEEEELRRFTTDPKVLASWKGKEHRKLVKAPVRKGCVEIVIEYCADGPCDEITRQAVRAKPGFNRVFLERINERCPS